MQNLKLKSVKTKQENINSDFQFRWLETILAGTIVTESVIKGVIERNDLVCLLKKFGIRFLEKNWEENILTKEMGNVLISDAPEEELLSEVKNLMENKYSDKLSFEKAEKIWLELSKLNLTDIAKKYIKISKNKTIKGMVDEYILQNKHPDEFNKEDILCFILDELYKLSKEEAEKMLM